VEAVSIFLVVSAGAGSAGFTESPAPSFVFPSLLHAVTLNASIDAIRIVKKVSPDFLMVMLQFFKPQEYDNYSKIPKKERN
jgi:hypothetical protein